MTAVYNYEMKNDPFGVPDSIESIILHISTVSTAA